MNSITEKIFKVDFTKKYVFSGRTENLNKVHFPEKHAF